MKKIFKPGILPLFTLIASLVGFGLRLWLFLSGRNESGLLPAGHLATILSFVLTAIVLVVLILCIRPLTPMGSYSKLFPGWVLSGIGCAAAAAGILYVDIRDLIIQVDFVTIATLVLGLLAAAGLLILGFCRWKGKHPSFWLQAALAVYFMLHLISQYRLWSWESQLTVYFFPLMASVFLMLTAYYGAVLDADKKANRRGYVFCNQAALFFCCMSLQGSRWPFYLAMAAWVGTGLCSLKLSPTPTPQPKPGKSQEPEQKER